ADEEATNYALMAYASSGSSSFLILDNELHSHKSDNRVPKNLENDMYKTSEGYHAVPPPYTGTFLPPKPDLVFTGNPNASESVANVINVESSTNKSSKDMSKTLRSDAPIVEDWISDSEDETEIESMSLNHLIKDCDYYEKQMVQKPMWNSAMRVNHQSSVRMTHPYSNRNVVSTTVLTRSRLVSLNAATPVTTAVTRSTVKSTWLVKHVVNKAHSPVRRPINQKTATKNSNFNKKVTIVKVNKVNVVQDFEEINGGCVAFGGNPKGGKITGKGKIKTGKLNFNDVYFVKKLKFNLFSISQMCNKKNGVLFTDTECVVLSSDFKLPDENHVLLRVQRENNMYNVYLKNVVSSGDLTCFFAKATLDESNLWHRRLRHIIFKTINKLVKGNLVRGLPSNIFENNHTCVACQKGKQHKASFHTHESDNRVPKNLKNDSTNKPSKDMFTTHRLTAPIIEDWISDSEDETEIESMPKQREPSLVTSTEHMKSSRESVKKVEQHKQAANLRKNNQKSRDRNVVPTAVLTRFRLVSLNAARPVPTVVTQSTMKKFEEIDRGYVEFGWNPKGEIDGGYVAFGGNPKGGKISGKGKIKTGKLDFDDVYFVKELRFNLFSVSQMCDKKNNVLFTDSECVVLSSDYKLPDKNHVLLRVPRENNMYNVDLKNVVPSGGLTCLFEKATLDESILWHKRLGHINFKTMNKLVMGNLVRGLPSKIFKNNHTCVVCQKGKQHKASCIKENLDARKVEKETVSAQQYVLLPLCSNWVTNDSAPANAAKPNLTKSTNSFNTASPSVNSVSLNFRIAGKSSFVDPSKYPDDPDMPKLEDIVYLDDKDDV
nr:putative ribonuclease H-like domain-containing protein [Tanacetum cinerariifolium]